MTTGLVPFFELTNATLFRAGAPLQLIYARVPAVDRILAHLVDSVLAPVQALGEILICLVHTARPAVFIGVGADCDGRFVTAVARVSAGDRSRRCVLLGIVADFHALSRDLVAGRGRGGFRLFFPASAACQQTQQRSGYGQKAHDHAARLGVVFSVSCFFSAPRTSSTGTVASRNTRSASLPRSSRFKPRRP